MDQKKWIFGIGAAVIVVLGLTSYFFSKSEADKSSMTVESITGDSDEPGTEITPSDTSQKGPEVATFFLDDTAQPEDTSLPLPNLDESDARVRQELGEVMPHPVSTRTIGAKHLIRKAVTSVDLVYRDHNPFSQLFFLQPDGAVQVDQIGDRFFLSENNFARYEGLVSALESVDEHKAARTYQLFLPLIREAFEELAYPDSSWNTVLDGALDSVMSAPVLEDPIEVLNARGVYVFADDELESLQPVQKLMVRMGPDNARRIKEKLRRIRQVLAR